MWIVYIVKPVFMFHNYFQLLCYNFASRFILIIFLNNNTIWFWGSLYGIPPCRQGFMRTPQSKIQE